MRKHIFLVDDDTDEARIFSEALNKLPGSYKCTFARNADQALKMLEFLTPDFIISDYNLPVTNGIELIDEIKKKRHLADIPCFLYSSRISSETQAIAREHSVAGCIEKPYSIGKLTSILNMILVPDTKEGQFMPKENNN